MSKRVIELVVLMVLASTDFAFCQNMDEMWGEAVVKLRAEKAQRGQLLTEGNYAMFIHWGLYSHIGNLYNGKSYYGIGEWIMNKNMANIPVDEYKALAKEFNPVKLDADCRLEITSWPDSLNMICYVESKAIKPDKIILRAGTKMSDKVLREQDKSLVVLLLIEGEGRAALEDVTVTAGKDTKINVKHSGTYGAYIIKIRDPGWSNQSGTYYPQEQWHTEDSSRGVKLIWP